MNKEFIPHQEALELKELGFDEPCFGYYEDNNLTITFPSTSPNGWKWVGNSIIPAKNTNAPLYQQAFRWFRKLENGSLNHLDFMYEYLKDDSMSYEEAEQACLKKLIQIVKENKQ
jgi:hypothetical protein